MSRLSLHLLVLTAPSVHEGFQSVGSLSRSNPPWMSSGTWGLGLLVAGNSIAGVVTMLPSSFSVVLPLPPCTPPLHSAHPWASPACVGKTICGPRWYPGGQLQVRVHSVERAPAPLNASYPARCGGVSRPPHLCPLSALLFLAALCIRLVLSLPFSQGFQRKRRELCAKGLPNVSTTTQHKGLFK